MPDDPVRTESADAGNSAQNTDTAPLDTNTVTPPILQQKVRSKKFIVASIVSLVLFTLGAAAAYEIVNANKYRQRLNKYQASQEFYTYSKDLEAFLDDNNSSLAKAYSCEATLDMIWYPPTDSLGDYTEPLDAQLFRSINTIRANWQKVEPQLPAYNGFIFSRILPQSKAAQKKHDQTKELLSKTGLMMNLNDLSSYCPTRVYPPLYGFSYLDQYSKPGTKIMESPDLLQQKLDHAKKSKQLLAEAAVPSEMGDVHQNLLTFFEKMSIDLSELINARKLNAGGVADMSDSFASNKNALEKSVLAKASEAGKQIQPTPADLGALLRNATAP